MKARIGGQELEIDMALMDDLERVRGGPATAGSGHYEGVGRRVTTRPHEAVPVATPAPAPLYRSKLEAAYARRLEARRYADDISWWAYESLSIRLPGRRNRYTPDFVVLVDPATKIEFHEVKGWSKNRREGIVKLKTAAALNPWATFRLVTYQGGQWREEVIR